MSKAKADEWKNPKGAYIHAMHLHNWGGYSYEVTGKDESGNLTYIGGWQNNRQMGMHSDFKYIENIREEMTEPGEWYFDKKNKRVYVILKPEHSLSDAEICVNSSFFLFKGCKNVRVENIKFRRAKRTFMQPYEPLLRSDWTIYRGGAIYFTNSSDCLVSDCSLFDIGTNGVFVDWSKVTGATGYIVYRKTSTTNWTEVGKTKKGTSFIDETAVEGKIYTYTVVATSGKYRSTYIAEGLKIKRLERPELESVKSYKTGIKFKWETVTGASGYYVYRKTGSGDWKQLAKVTDASTTSYFDKTAKKGKTYYYSVRAYSGSYKSAYNTKGLKIKDKY